MGCFSAVAQDIPADIDKGEQNPFSFISSTLLEVHKGAMSSVSEGLAKAQSMYMPLKGNSIYVEIIRGAQEDLDLSIEMDLLRAIPNIELTTQYKNRASAWAPVDQLLAIGQSLPPGYRLSEVISPPPADNQGPGLTNSDSYSGPGGAGLVVAVIDGGFDMFTEARNAGAAPTAGNTTIYNYTGNPFESAADGVHGTACVETFFDHVPDADFVICKINSISDLGTAVTDCISEGVDVISHSQSRYNTGWGDNTGAACTAAADASNNSILFFTSSGNRHGTHWQGNFSDDGDDWHNWSGGDEQNNFTMNGTAGNASSVWANLQWNSASTTDHYDLYLYNANTNTIIASSTNTNDFESISFSTNSSLDVYLAVFRKSANPPAFELFNHDDACTNFQYFSTEGSSTSPSNSTAANVVSVGAVATTDYNDPSGTSGILASYSSRGPTNSGNQAPDVVAPTNTTTVAYGGGFSGTSCSTPNAAGTAAAFWSGHTQLSASGVRQILFAKADIYKDWGTAGADDLYGRGGVFLYDYSSLNRYVLKSAGNTTSLLTLPFYSIDDVDDDANPPSGHRIIYLDANDDAPGAGQVINKPMLYKSINGTLID